MKAKEYVERYGMALSELHRTDLDKATPETKREVVNRLEDTLGVIFNDFREEFRQLAKKRNARSYSGKYDVARELNDKWNAVIRLMEKTYGVGVLQRNAFLNDFKSGRVRTE